MNENAKNYLMLGFAISDESYNLYAKLDKFPQIQTHRYIWSFIKSLSYSNAVSVKYISTCPISDYPHNKKIFVLGKEYECEVLSKKLKIKEVSFINFSILKIITRFISFLTLAFIELYKNKNQGIIVYSVSVPLMLAGYFLSIIFKTELIGIWTDPPSVPNMRDSYIKRKLRGVEYELSLLLMKKFNKIFPVTRQLALDFNKTAGYFVVDGFSSEHIQYNSYSSMSADYSGNLIFLYTGTLDKKYGIDKMCSAFIKLPFSHIKLVIYGAGDYTDSIVELCSNDKRVEFRGFSSHQLIIAEQKKANFLVNFRSPFDDYVKYSFPSKTLEYLSSGTPLISTLLPGFSDEYKEALIPLADNSIEEIYDKLYEIVTSLDLNYISETVNKGIQLAQSRTSRNRSETIVKFLLKEM